MTNTKLRKETFDNQVARVEGMLNTCGLNSYEGVLVLHKALEDAKEKYKKDERLGRLDKWKEVMHKKALRFKEDRRTSIPPIRLITPVAILLISIITNSQFGFGLGLGWLICYSFTKLWEKLKLDL
jgi:hypothetical protein